VVIVQYNQYCSWMYIVSHNL